MARRNAPIPPLPTQKSRSSGCCPLTASLQLWKPLFRMRSWSRFARYATPRRRRAISPRRTGARSVTRPPRPRPLPDMEGAGSPPFLKGGQTEPALESIQGTCLPSVPIRSGFEQKHRKVEEFPWVFPPVSTLRYPGSPTPVPSRGD